MHAKLQNGLLRSAPKTIVLDGRTINNPYDSELEQLGYTILISMIQHSPTSSGHSSLEERIR